MGLVNDRPFLQWNKELGRFEKKQRPPEELGVKKYYQKTGTYKRKKK